MADIDVRDMLCAQALAVVSRAAGRLEPGDACDVLYSAADVRHDLLVWAGERGLRVEEPREGCLRLRKDRP